MNKNTQIVKLSQNENAFGAPPLALKAIEEDITSVEFLNGVIMGGIWQRDGVDQFVSGLRISQAFREGRK